MLGPPLNMASNPALTCKPELVVYDMPDLDADLPIGEHHHHTAGDEEATAAALNGTLTCKTEHIVDNETVDELLARAERMIAQNQESIELHQMSYELIQTLDESVMDEFVDSTLADADQAISNAQHILDESSVDGKVYINYCYIPVRSKSAEDCQYFGVRISTKYQIQELV